MNNSMQIAETIIKAWRSERDEYFEILDQQLGQLLLENGLVGAWYSFDLELRLHERSFPANQQKLAQKLTRNAESLIAEIVSSSPSRSQKDDLRILGLLGVYLSNNQEIPSFLKKNLLFRRDSLDTYALTCLQARTYVISGLLRRASEDEGSKSHVMDSLYQYYNVFESPLAHRRAYLASEDLFILTPWNDITSLIKSMITIATLIHDQKYHQAVLKATNLHQQFPACSEVKFLLALASMAGQDNFEFPSSIDLDPLLFYRGECLSFSPLHRWRAFSQSKQARQTCQHIAENIGCGLDPSIHDIARSMTINWLDINGEYGKSEENMSLLSDKIISYSSYDPFELTLFSAAIEEIQFDLQINESILYPKLDLNLVFACGLPGPFWSLLDKWLSCKKIIALMKSDELIQQMVERTQSMIENTSYPGLVEHLNIDHLNELRTFYLQNLSFCHGGLSKERVVDLCPQSFKHLVLLARVFPEANFVAIQPPLEQSLFASYASLSGYSSSHATATLSELVSYAYDYASVVSTLNKFLGERLQIITLAQHNPLLESNLIKLFIQPCSDSLPVESFDYFESIIMYKKHYPFLAESLKEHNSELRDIRLMLSPQKDRLT